MPTLTIDSTTPPERILSSSSLTLNLPQPPKEFYRHGWQSWSLAAWTDPLHEIPVMKPEIFHSRQTDQLYAHHPHPNGSWLGAVELPDGNIIFIGALNLEAHIDFHDGTLNGWYDSGTGEWFIAYGKEFDVFKKYTDLLSKKFGHGKFEKAPRVWCSWYSLYNTISEDNLLKALNALGDLPFDVFQIDDGWEIGPGDWQPNKKFLSGMDGLAEKIRATGRKAGLWMAPLMVGKSSSIAKDHPDWLLKNSGGKPVSSGFEWGGECLALDATHPEAADWLTETIQNTRKWGYDYLKLDFLYAGALPGKRHNDMPREIAYRHALEIIHRAAGDAYLLVCGAPILPSLGLCDGMRSGPDVANFWDNNLYSYLLYNQTTPGVKNGIRTTLNRLWLRPLVNIDPDVAYFHASDSLTPEQRNLFRDFTEICGFKATSDLPQTWSVSERASVHEWLESKVETRRTGRYTFAIDDRTVDFGPAMPLPLFPTGFNSVLRDITGFLGNQIWALRIWTWIARNKIEKDK